MKGGCDQWLTYWLLRNSGALQYHFSFIKQKSCTINHPIREASNVMVGIYFRSVKLALPAFSVVGVVLSARYLPSSTSSRTPSLQLWNREQCSFDILLSRTRERQINVLLIGNTGTADWRSAHREHWNAGLCRIAACDRNTGTADWHSANWNTRTCSLTFCIWNLDHAVWHSANWNTRTCSEAHC